MLAGTTENWTLKLPTEHTHADTLSRLPCQQCGHENYKEIDVAVTVAVTTLQPTIAEHLCKGCTTSRLLCWVLCVEGEEEQKPKLENLSSTSCLTRRYLQIWEQL